MEAPFVVVRFLIRSSCQPANANRAGKRCRTGDEAGGDHRCGPGGADGGGGAVRRRAARHRLRADAVGRPQISAGRPRRAQSHPQRAARSVSARYGAPRRSLLPAIEAFPPDALRAWAEALGQETFVGTSGRVFPKAMKASPLAARLAAPARCIRRGVSRRAIAGTAGATASLCCSRRPTAKYDRAPGRHDAGAWRRELAEAWLERAVGRSR